MVDPRAGTPAQPQDLVDLDALAAAYYDRTPDPDDPAQQVAFGTSGHRGSSLDGAFNEAHILAITQAIVEHRAQAGIDGPILMGRDTHALSLPAWHSALEVLIGNDVVTLVDTEDGFTPTPAVSHAILRLNALGAHGQVDGIVVTPSHNPPRDGGFKYNPPHGGPAGSDITGWIQDRANALIRDGLRGVKRATTDETRDRVQSYDFLTHYVNDLGSIVDLEAITRAGVRIGADPLGGASVAYWGRIGEEYGLDLTVVNSAVDPQWAFMTLDHDGKIRMDCSSPYAMASLVEQRERFDVATGNDADADRHGIVTPDGGLMNPNHFLAVAIGYLAEHRDWDAGAGVGKTVVSSSMIDRVVADAGRALYEVPVGFKWFVDPLLSGSAVFGGEESAGASFLRKDGSVWTTDKDGIVLALLASEIQAVTGRSASQHYAGLTARHGDPAYARVDSPATREEKKRLGALEPGAITATDLAGDPITRVLSHAPGNDAAIGGIKVETEHAWFAARPSGTEDVYKIYAESFRGPEHLAEVQDAARAVVGEALT
ncbi:phosphoglucomutase (alpha-D-glucose-1,6-bisphosphate-dependent) [Mumia sp. DW29H23]|uniref:phosphoglucomutase (alpha-D-glucose-1,6-bisphosphate-dependent) n=1 Tax=Mumia sp. DW29H23 TaxID=3421241 RepID=UPI003D68049E